MKENEQEDGFYAKLYHLQSLGKNSPECAQLYVIQYIISSTSYGIREKLLYP